MSGNDVLARLDEHLQPTKRIDDAIPAAWVARGYVHIGDIDVSGSTLYVPFEQPDYDLGHQVMARYDAGTLAFRDAKVVAQHENSFVAVDGASGIAYSMDRFGGDALLRYDTRAGWRRLTPLYLDRTLEKVQGAAIARDAVWLMTDDDHNGIYRVEHRLRCGERRRLRSSGGRRGGGHRRGDHVGREPPCDGHRREPFRRHARSLRDIGGAEPVVRAHRVVRKARHQLAARARSTSGSRSSSSRSRRSARCFSARARRCTQRTGARPPADAHRAEKSNRATLRRCGGRLTPSRGPGSS